MEKINLPGDKVLNLPDDIDPQLRAQIAADIKADFGIDINQTSVLGRAAEIPKAIARGASGLAIDAPLGIAALFDVGDDGKIVKGLQGFKKRIREESPIAATPGYEDLWTTKLGEGLGSFVPFLGAGIAGRALTKTPKPFFSKGYFKTPEFTLPTALAIPTGVAQQADRVQQAREMGEDVGGVSETVAELFGGAIGITEVLPIGALLARTSKTALKDYALRDKIRSALIQGTQEGAQEVFASLAQDLTARGLYSDELPIGESLLDEFTIGGVIGAGADLVVNSFAGRRGIGNENLRQREGQLRQNRIQLQDEKRFDKAVDQGLVEEIQPVETKEKPDIPIPVGEIQPLPNFEIIQDTQGNFNLIDTTKEGSPVLKTFSGEAEAITAKEKELNKLRVKNLKIDIENDLYNQGLINSATGFDLGVILKDPNSIEINPQSIINFDSRVKKADRKEIETYFKNKNIELKPTFTMQEVRQILSPKDLKNFQSDLAQQIFRQSEKRGEPSIRDDKNQVNVNNKYIKELAESKNIELDFKDPAVQYFTRQVTGYDDLTKVKNRGAKELFVARLHSLPKFNFKTKLPDFRPREYTAEDMANFVANAGANDIQFSVKDLLQAGPTAGNKNATEQFIRDLTTSGRANKVEGTNKYKINKNYEFEVARKAEGFNETPEEFGERLTREGVLPPETIEQLVAAEQLRQEKYLPPKEVAPKMINFAQSVEEGRVNKFAREARKILDKAGLKETGVVISDDILSTTSLVQTPEGVIKRDPRKTDIAEAEYDRDTDIVFVSLNAVNPDGLATDLEIQQRINRIIDHEMIHALRAKDLINEQEYQYLRQEVKRRKVPESVDATAFKNKETYYTRSKRINTQVEQSQRGKDYKEEVYVEEAIAELYRNRFSKPDIPKKAETIFEKIAQFFKSMGQALRRSGFDKSSDIFTAIEEGEVGTRERGEIRTLREIDRVPLSEELQPIVEIDETKRPRTPYTTTGIDEEGNEVIINTTPIDNFPGTVPLKPLKGVTLRPRIGVGGQDTTPVGEVYDVRKLTTEEYQDTKNFILDNYKKIYKDVPRGVAKDGRKFLSWMKDNAPNQDYKVITSKVLETLNKLADAGVQTFIDIRSLSRGVRGQNAYNMATKNNTVTLSNRRDVGAADDGVNYETILHEFIHSATVPIIYQRKGSFKGLNKKAEKLFKNLEELQELTAKSIVERIDELEASLIKAVSNEETLATEVSKIVDSVVNRPAFERDYVNKLTERLISSGRIDLQERNKLIKDYTSGYKKGSFGHLIGYKTFGIQRARAGQSPEQYQKDKQADIAEFLTFGLTNRDYQEILESISYVPRKQSAWSKFVDSIREFLGLPVKANTALSGFLENASSLIDIAASQAGEIAFGDIGEVITRSDRQSVDRQISQLNDRIFTLERRLQADRPYLPNSTIIKEQNQIGRLKAQVAQLEQERRDLPPEQPPLFSRAPTKDSPAYLDLTKENLEYTNEWVKNEIENSSRLIIPFITRMPINDFLNLTASQKELERIRLESPKPVDVLGDRVEVDPDFSPEIFNRVPRRMNRYVGAYPYLTINEDGKVTGHEGRHRLALGQKGGAVDAPVIIMFEPTSAALPQKEKINSAKTLEDLEIKSLTPQFKDSAVNKVDLLEDTNIINEQNINRALAIATLPDGIEERKQLNDERKKSALFSIQQIQNIPENLRSDPTYSSQLETHYDNLISLGYLESSPLDISDVPLFSRSTRYATDSSSSKNKKLIEATERVEEIVKSTPNGEIPTVNPNASDIAFESFLEFNDVNNTQAAPDDIPSFSIGAIPDDFRDVEDKIGYIEPTKSFGARIIDFTADPIESIKDSFKFVRTQLIDKLDLVDKKIVQATEDNEEVRLANNTADTATMAALRMADRARGLFQGMLTRGFVTDTIDGEAALANVNDLDISTVYNPYIEGDTGTGGLMQIIAPLYADPTVNREFLFKAYATAKRTKNLTANGNEIETPLSRNEALETIENIEQNYPSVVEVYNNYQNWNNKLITFAENKGLLNPEQAALWRAHSSYYPFYRKMVDDDLSAPSIGGGSLPNNPLSIKITGSDNPLDVDPIEAIARNSLSILTAALKNDGTSKLLRDLSSIGEAVLMTNPQEIKRARLNRIFTFENGEKVFYKVLDPELFYGLQSVGGMQTDFITKLLAAPASLLRDTVTRDPGFVVVNVLRDTLSSAVTSGAPIGADGFTPVIDSFKNLFADMEDLEKFGVLGGYDFQNDEGSVKQFIDRSLRQQGLQPDNSTNAKDMFFKLWDGLGALTTKSDGATRKAVYDSVYNKLIKEGYTEAQAQSEAAFQALEIINFGRRGLSPMFRTITAAIPFLNARIQGLDVLFRSFTGKYSASDKLQEGESRDDVRKRILRRAFTRGGFLMALTALYYMMVSDDEEYQNLRREVRDDNWIIPLADGIPALKIPIPFEVGMLFKTFPERFIDEFMGREIEPEPLTSVKRQLGTSAKVPFFDAGLGFQLLKPFAEVYQNRNTFTNTEIVPYYQQKLERGLQARPSSNELLRVIGETFNISPAKLEHVLRGYTGTLGGYVLDIADVTARGVTGTPLIPPNLNSVPVLRRLLLDIDRSGGGLQQQFYELRSEVDTVVQTMNKLRKNERFDEYSAYRSNMQGVLNVKGQVRSIERYLDNYRKRRDRLLRRTDISASAKSELLKQMELERDRRLAIVPELRDKANIPVMRGV